MNNNTLPIIIQTEEFDDLAFIREVTISEFNSTHFLAEAVSIHLGSGDQFVRGTVLAPTLEELINKANDWVSYKEEYFY